MAQADRRESTNNPARVAVTAAGVISPLGIGLAETLESLRSARDCVTSVMRFSVTQCRCKTAGQVSDSRLLASYAQIPRSGRLHRASHMMIQALKELVAQQPEFEPELMVIGTTSGGMSYGERYYRSLNGAGDLRHAPTWIANYPAQKPVIDAQTAFGISAPCQVIANACASGTNAIGHAFECVRSGRYQRVLAGGYSALIRFKPQRRRNAARLIAIGLVWCSVKAPRCWPWKISTSLASEARLFSRKSSVTAFPQTTFTSRNRSHRASERDKQWSGLSRARISLRPTLIISMRMVLPRSSTMQPRARQSPHCLMVCQLAQPKA